MEIEIENVKNLVTLGDLFKELKKKYDLNYKGWEGIDGLFEYYKFKKNRKNEYYELNRNNIRELAENGKTYMKVW